jgi:O-antigen/teichoic acid export membrane protein
MALPLAVGMAAAAEPIVNLIYGSGFEPSITALQLMAWNVPQFSLGAVLWRVLAARNQQDLVLRARIITLVIRLVSGYVLISQFSVVGAAVATTFNLFLNALLLAAYIKQDGTRLNLIPTGWRFAIAALGMGILTLVLHHLDLWLLIPLVATIYTLLAFLLKAFSPDDFALFRKVWQPTTIRRGP